LKQVLESRQIHQSEYTPIADKVAHFLLRLHLKLGYRGVEMSQHLWLHWAHRALLEVSGNSLKKAFIKLHEKFSICSMDRFRRNV